MGIGVINTQYNYDFQPVLQDGLSTIESGLATNAEVEVKEGDIVYNADGVPEPLAKGTRVSVGGQTVEWDGASPLTLPQLTVTYKLKPYTWSDGTPGSIEDVKLAFQINCDRAIGAVTYSDCDTWTNEANDMSNVSYGEGLEYTIKYWPGVQTPTYQIAPFSIAGSSVLYPAHQVLSDGRNLADVPPEEWATLPEIAETPLSYGPFMITEWIKGQSITLDANPHYAGGTGAQRIVVLFIQDTNQAVAQLLAGEVDYLERVTLGAGAEVQTVVDAAAEGKLTVEIIPSPSWEHLDFNLYTK
jgi:ABC-type transport system substrate-binding protein